MLTNYDAHEIVIYKYTVIMFTEYVWINYNFVSINCEHDTCVYKLRFCEFYNLET